MTDDSLAFCYRMLAETGVAAAPGVDFDTVEGQRYLRFTFAPPRHTLTNALDALSGWLPRL